MNLVEAETADSLCAICGGSHSCSNCSLFAITNHVPDNKVPSKARLTLPKTFKIETMAEGTQSIVSMQIIPKGTLFGPLEASRIFNLNPEIVFPLKIFTDGEEDYFGEYYLNNINENECNWMIFICPAQSYEEQNLICYQDKESIYYLSIRDIPLGEHLKVWYAPFYAKRMNKHILEKKILEDVPPDVRIDINALVKKQQNIQERESWTCKFCGIMEKEVAKFAVHISEHYAMQLRNACTYCKSSFISAKSLSKHIKIVHSNGLVNHQNTNEKVAVPVVTRDKVTEKDSLLGGPLLNDILTDSMDNTNLLLHQTDFEIGLGSQNILLDSENLNVDNLLISENVKELDHFNFEIDENQEQFICDICLKEFPKLKSLILHLNKHTGKYTCHLCYKIFSRKENLQAHVCTIPNQPFQCAICEKTFSLKKYLIRHTKEYHERKFHCKHCNKTYACNQTFKEHNCILNAPKQYKCDQCGKLFLKNSYLRRHMKLHRDKKKKEVVENEEPKAIFVCEMCSNTFTTASNLKVHMRTHLEPTFACDQCDSKFHRQDVLDNHKASHKEIKPGEFSCEICGKNLKTKKYLQQHLKLHQNQYSYTCTDCPQTFSIKANVKKHLEAIHKKTCSTCNLTFQTYEQAQMHRAQHFDSFYTCPVCKRNVKLRSSMRRHIKKVHPEYDLTEAGLNSCKVTNKSPTKEGVEQNDGDQHENGEETSLDSETNKASNSIEESNSRSNEGYSSLEAIEKVSESKEFMLAESFESSDLTNLDVNEQIEKSISINQSEFDVDSFDDLDLNMGMEKLVNNDDVSQSFSNDNYNQSDLGIPITSNLEETENILDFNNLEMELDRAFNIPTEIRAPVCVSMPEIVQDVTLGENAYMLNNGTIIEPRDQGNVVVYILDRKFDTNNGANKNGMA